MTSTEMKEAIDIIADYARSGMLCIDERQRQLLAEFAATMGRKYEKPAHKIERHTIEKKSAFHLYKSDGRYFVDYYHGGIIHSYSTEQAAREAINKALY